MKMKMNFLRLNAKFEIVYYPYYFEKTEIQFDVDIENRHTTII